LPKIRRRRSSSIARRLGKAIRWPVGSPDVSTSRPVALRDPEAARKSLKLAADQNNAYGAYYLGRLMADKDPTKSPALYKIAADQGLPQAQYFYAKTLKDGHGVPQDRLTAYIWFNIAADAGYTAALQDLNELDRSGSFTMDQISTAKQNPAKWNSS